MKIHVKHRKSYNHYQFFMQQFVDSCIKKGFKIKKDIEIPNIYFKFLETIYLLWAKYISPIYSPKKALLITAAGDTLFKDSVPYIFNHKIIPMLWDVWPERWNGIYYYLKLFKCNIVFCTVKSFAEQLEQDLKIKAYWIPEGIDISLYSKGDILINRNTDVLELGRQKKEYHEILENLFKKNKINGYYRSLFYPDGTYKLAFNTASELIEKLPTIKIVISFPRTDTHPKQAGNLETLTQRYWECMLSRCLILGRAPKELIKLIGYNPVIDIDWDNPIKQFEEILNKISNYQKLVDKNYTIALKYASWDLRTTYIKHILQEQGYTV